MTELEKYKKGYYKLMEFWVYIPDDKKRIVDEELKKLGL